MQHIVAVCFANVDLFMNQTKLGLFVYVISLIQHNIDINFGYQKNKDFTGLIIRGPDPLLDQVLVP